MSKAVEAAAKVSYLESYSPDAREVAGDRIWQAALEGPFAEAEREVKKVSKIIRAFLDAAAEEEGALAQVEYSLAPIIGGNRQPDMSGDPRNRLSTMQRRVTSDAARAAILSLKQAVEG